jgi:sulfate transport system ATP-binding protein
MDVAEQIVVMNEGAVEQAGSPTDLYDHPNTEFVMGFVGTANRIGDRLVRPHDVEISHLPTDRAEEAMIDRIVHLGFEVRIEMTLADASPLIAQLTRAQVEELELAERQIVYVLPSRARVFDSNGGAPRTEELALA